MNISQIKFGYLSDSHFTFLWDAYVADISGDWCDWIWRNYLMLIFWIEKIFDVDFIEERNNLMLIFSILRKVRKFFFCDFFRRIPVIGNNYAHGFIWKNALVIKFKCEIDDER